MRDLAAILTATLLLAGCFGNDEPKDVPAELDDPPVQPTVTTPASPNVAPPPAADPGPPGSEDPATPAEARAAAAPRVEVTGWNATITGAGASPPAGPACCVWRTAAGETAAAFEVPPGVKAVVVELTWADATFDLDLQVLGADYAETIPPSPDGADTRLHDGHAWSATQGAPGSPDAHTTITIREPEALVAGSWAWRIGAEGPANAIPFAVHVSLFLDAPPGDGYSALASSDNP